MRRLSEVPGSKKLKKLCRGLSDAPGLIKTEELIIRSLKAPYFFEDNVILCLELKIGESRIFYLDIGILFLKRSLK